MHLTMGNDSPASALQAALASLDVESKPTHVKDWSKLPEYKEKTVLIKGWVHNRRGKKGLFFLDLRLGPHKKEVVPTFTKECTIAIIGRVEKLPEEKVAPMGIEIQIEQYSVLGTSPAGGLKSTVAADSSMDILLDKRYLTLRFSKYTVWIKLFDIVLKAYREFCNVESKMVEVIPPTLSKYKGEGGSDVFSVKYFQKEAYLCQTSQLYLEAAVPVVGSCYCVLPSFRAEKSRTVRHLTEYSHAEAELPFFDLDDLMDHLESLIRFVNKRVKESEIIQEIKLTNPDAEINYLSEEPFLRYTYKEYVDELKKLGITKEGTDNEFYTHDEDVPSLPERLFINKIKKPCFITHFPAHLKAFYMEKNYEDPSLSESVDLLLPGVGEVVGGSIRMSDYDKLNEALITETGLEKAKKSGDLESIAKAQSLYEAYSFYLDLRKYGSGFTGGYGLGLSRLLMFYGLNHIYFGSLFPRTATRLAP